MSAKINLMFSSIHKRYDLMNSVLSFGMDRIWRKEAAAEALIPGKSYRVLDIAAGTGELSIAIKRAGDLSGRSIDVCGLDFNESMLEVAKRKAARSSVRVRFVRGDALRLGFPENNFDVVTSAFALRDFDDTGTFASESFRVLRNGGKLVLLEMSLPKKGFGGLFFRFYSRIMLLEGTLVDREAYSFLVKTITAFDTEALIGELRKSGFRRIRRRTLASSAAFIVTAFK